MKVCVVGAGSIGGYVGVKLALAGEDVTLIARLADAGPHDVVILGTHGLNGGPASTRSAPPPGVQ